MRCSYDDSLENPALVEALAKKKTSTPVDVRLGEETLDEMCLASFVFLSKLP
jgi:hypothetical protein